MPSVAARRFPSAAPLLTVHISRLSALRRLPAHRKIRCFHLAVVTPAGAEMGRFIGLLIVVAIVAWLATREVKDTDRTVREAATAAGLKDFKPDGTQPSARISEQIGKQVESTIQSSKERIDADCSVNGDCPE